MPGTCSHQLSTAMGKSQTTAVKDLFLPVSIGHAVLAAQREQTR